MNTKSLKKALVTFAVLLCASTVGFGIAFGYGYGTPTPTPAPTQAPGAVGGSIFFGNSTHPVDINGDGKIDIFDFNILMANWGATGNNIADLNGDGIVDMLDFNMLMTYWS